MANRRFRICLLLISGWMLIPSRASAVAVSPVVLWQEDTYWDALLTTRSKAARQSADPNLIPVLQSIAQQVAQQALNLRQVEAYTKVQQDNLKYAALESDPSESLTTIQANLDTLGQGVTQIRSNLFYLGTRCRMASSQALPDPELTSTATILIRQIQAVQLQLNTIYLDATALQTQIQSMTRPKREAVLHYRADSLVHSVRETQDSVFTVYNASYEIYLRSKE